MSSATTALRRPVHISSYLAVASIAVLFGRVLWRSEPFDLASYAAWAGIFLALAALGFW